MTVDLMRLSDKVCESIRKDIPNKWGLFRTERFDVDKSIWPSDMCDPDDLGDFAIFMVWKDMVTGKKDNIDWVNKQMDDIDSKLKRRCGLYHPFSDGSAGVSQSGIAPVFPLNHLDMILGCNMLYMLLGEKKYLDNAISICDAVSRHALSRNGFIYGSVIPAFNMYYPAYGFLRHKLVVSGVFIEEFSLLYRLTKNKKYIQDAEKMADAWFNTPTFRRHGICCDNVWPVTNRESGYDCNLGKPNTNFSNGVLRLYETTKNKKIKEQAQRNIEGLTLFRNDDGSFASRVNSTTGKISVNSVEQAPNHMVMGTLMDAYQMLGNKRYLSMAEECMDFWLSVQDKSGLFPMRTNGVGDWNICNMDTHADITVMMSRLRLLTGKKKYLEAVERSADAFRYFEKKGKLYMQVDLDGRKVNSYGELKYLGGFMKGIMSSYTVLKNVKKVDKNMLRLLMRDR